MFKAWKHHRSWMTPVLLMVPGVLLFWTVIVASTVQSLWISFQEWDGLGPKVWVGFSNYVELFNDPRFYTSLRNNVIWLVMFLLAPVLGLAIALLVNQPIRGMRLAKSIFFFPLVLAQVTVGVIFSWLFDPSFGLLAQFFFAVGATPPALLSNETLVTFAVVIAALWPQVALSMVLFLAGLQNLNEEVLSAGLIDGAKGWNLLRHVVLPQLKHVAFLSLAVAVIHSLRSFDIVSVMTQGGPYGSSSVLAYLMYEQSIFSYRFGYGAATASILLLIMICFITWYLYYLLNSERRG